MSYALNAVSKFLASSALLAIIGFAAVFCTSQRVCAQSGSTEFRPQRQQLAQNSGPQTPNSRNAAAIDVRVVGLPTRGMVDWGSLVGVGFGAILGVLISLLTPMLTVWCRGPKLHLRTDPKKIALPESTYPSPLRQEDLWIRVLVTNRKPRIARACRGYLAKIEQWNPGKRQFEETAYNDNLQLVWSYCRPIDTLDIPKDVPRPLDVVKYTPNSHGYEPQLRSSTNDILKPRDYESLFRQDGKFQFTVLVSADDVEPVPIKFIVDWDGQSWPPTVQEV